MNASWNIRLNSQWVPPKVGALPSIMLGIFSMEVYMFLGHFNLKTCSAQFRSIRPEAFLKLSLPYHHLAWSGCQLVLPLIDSIRELKVCIQATE